MMEQIMEALEQGWSPNDDKSPFYNWHLIHEEEWRRIARWFPYSVRVLNQYKWNNEEKWSEKARTATLEKAQDVLQALVQHGKQDKSACWCVMEYDCSGDQVREKPVFWHPNQEQVLATLRQAGLLKTPK